jgi:rusticyanin
MSEVTEHPEPVQHQRWLSSRRFTRGSRTGSRAARSVLVLALIAAAAATGGALGARRSGAPTRTVRATGTPASGQETRAQGRKPAAAATSTTAAATAPSSDPTAASDPAAFYAGRAMTGNGDTAVPLSRAEQLAGQVPSGAAVDPSTNAIRFSGSAVSLVVLASPPSHDMTFRIAGMTDPAIQVRQGAHITLQFINGDSDMAHMLIIGRDPPARYDAENAGQSAAAPGSAVAAARPLGDPTSAGQPAETITFTAPAAGRYWYYCAFPGHAAQGMRGRFTVRA